MDSINSMSDSSSDNKNNISEQFCQKQPKYIKNLSQKERQEFIDSFDTVFCDIDGVIWHALRDPIPGSSDGINYLEKLGKRVTYVTNNSVVSLEEQLAKFAQCNIKVKKQDIIHPAQTISYYLKSINFEGLILCLSTTSFRNVLRDEGFELVEDKNAFIPETVHHLRDAIYTGESIKAVVIDIDFNLTAVKLIRAHVALKDPECLFIGGAADTLVSFGSKDIIGPGPFINVVETSTKRKAVILGKPGDPLRDLILKRFNLRENPKRALFIGDSLTSDVRFGKMCGFQTLVVLTGTTKPTDLMPAIDVMETPDYVATCLGDLNLLL